MDEPISSLVPSEVEGRISGSALSPLDFARDERISFSSAISHPSGTSPASSVPARASCVTSSRAFIRAEPKTTHDFLRAYVAGIRLTKKNHAFAEKSFAKWMREKNPAITKKTVEAYARLLKTAPLVPDKGIENVIQDLVKARPEVKEYLGWPEPFRENGPLEKVLREK